MSDVATRLAKRGHIPCSFQNCVWPVTTVMQKDCFCFVV